MAAIYQAQTLSNEKQTGIRPMEKNTVQHIRVTNKQYDITGQEMTRIGKHYLISKLSKYEALGGGPGLKNIIIMFGVHYFINRFPGIEASRPARLLKKIFRKLS